MRSALSFAIVALLCAILWLVSQGSIEDAMRDIAMMLVGIVVAKFGTVFDFWFGSSDGSKKKDDAIATLADEVEQ
jgi:hypothetical protein